MSERETSPVPKWRALRWLPASHGEVWAAATAVWLLLAIVNAVIGWPMIRTLAPALLLMLVGAVESRRLRRGTAPVTAD